MPALALISADYSAPARREIIASVRPEVTNPGLTDEMIRERRLANKRAAAIAILGRRWIGHPAYRFELRHSNDPTIWPAHSVLRPIHDAARRAGRI